MSYFIVLFILISVVSSLARWAFCFYVMRDVPLERRPEMLTALAPLVRPLPTLRFRDKKGPD